MKKYFINEEGRLCGEVLTDNPVNPMDYKLIDCELTGPCTDYEVVDGVVVYSPITKTPEEILTGKKDLRSSTIAKSTVTTSTGKLFDADEIAQARMDRALRVAELTGVTETTWVLATNDPVTITLDELKEAFILSVQAMGAVWTNPYE